MKNEIKYFDTEINIYICIYANILHYKKDTFKNKTLFSEE